MQPITKRARFAYRAAPLGARFVAIWLLASTLIAVVLGAGLGIATGLVIAIGYAGYARRTSHEIRRGRLFEVIGSRTADPADR
jgi:hypothetical protein